MPSLITLLLATQQGAAGDSGSTAAGASARGARRLPDPDFWTQALDIWEGGGWAMFALALASLVIFGIGSGIYVRLRRIGFQQVPEVMWRRWIEVPAERYGPIGALLDRVTRARTIEESVVLHRQLRAAEKTPFERDLRVMKICVSAAPLIGLLGTVTGMIATFKALQGGSGGDKTMASIAEGISVALITTETGLVIALPGLFVQYALARKFEQYKAFLAGLETVCNQVLYAKTGRHRRQARPELRAARRAALAQIATALQGGAQRTPMSLPSAGAVGGNGNGSAAVHAEPPLVLEDRDLGEDFGSD